MLRTLIVEDELHAQKETQLLLASQPGFTWIGTCSSVQEARILLKSTKPDLVLLDIELDDGNAFDLLQTIEPIDFRIVFTTAFNDHAIKAIKFGALDYLLKPLNPEEFAATLDKVKSLNDHPVSLKPQLELASRYMQQEQKSTRDRIALRDQYHIRIVSFSDILYCQSNNGYTTFFLADGEEIMVSRSIKEHERLLPESVFIRIHQSYLVNIEHVKMYHKEGYIIMKNNKELPVSVRKRDEVIRLLLQY